MLDFYFKEIIYIQYLDNMDDFKKNLENKNLINHFVNFFENCANEINKGTKQIKFENFDVNIIKTAHILHNTPIRIKNLLKMTLIYLMAKFEAFNHDYFTRLLSIKPNLMIIAAKHFNKKYTLTFDHIVEYHNRDELFSEMINRFISSIPSNIDIFITKFLEPCLNINFSIQFKGLESLKESYYRRNAIVHNNGRYSEDYIKQMNYDSNLLNNEIEINIEYLETCYNNLINYIILIENIVLKLFPDLKIEL